MVVTSPRTKFPNAGDRVITLGQQARSMMMQRCDDVISIVVDGENGVTFYGRIPTVMQEEAFQVLRRIAKSLRFTRVDQGSLVFCLITKRVNHLSFTLVIAGT